MKQRNAAVVTAGWGDENAESDCINALNPHYDAGLYRGFSEATNRNLARVDEGRIDYDLLVRLRNVPSVEPQCSLNVH